mgnify:CR=1 FL=1
MIRFLWFFKMAIFCGLLEQIYLMFYKVYKKVLQKTYEKYKKK